MTCTGARFAKRRLQILDDETRDAPRFKSGRVTAMSASLEDLWVRNFMARLAASVRSLAGRP